MSWRHLDSQASRYFQMMEVTAEARNAAVMAQAERIKEAWRNRTPEEVAAYELACRRQTSIQFDSEREAEQQGITMDRYVRGNV